MSQPPGADTELTRFAILFEARSGSTYLTEALNSHPLVRAEKEHLAALREQVRQDMAEPCDQLNWVHQFFRDVDNGRFRAVGFKTKRKDILDSDGLAALLRECHVKIILLQRRNRIKLMVSLINAAALNAATGDWNLYNRDDRRGRIAIDVPQFCEWLEGIEHQNHDLREYVRRLELPTLALCYEDILLREKETFEGACEFLGVPYQPLRGNCIKHTSDDLREVVANYDELRSHFLGTKYEEMFNEVLVAAR